ncbi:ferredoxin-NADP reductase [Prauserella sediminis]|uniref:Ferredoxin-NADP reductase n=2 Tax=Prauserella salsuginis group TaxID=2893672 RepID=A0A839XJI0_9PSEU|nr:ferredoxin-NADP reductase [Prauserella sediminis]
MSNVAPIHQRGHVAEQESAGTARVTEIRREADGVMGLVLTDPVGDRLPDWAPGAHIDLVLPDGTTRQYSLCGDRWDAHSYRVAVLREPSSRGGSAFVHDSLREGDLVGIGGPRNNFALVPAARYLFVAGGIGITPLLPMIAQAELLGADWNLLYGGRTRTSMAFLDELGRYGERVRVEPQDESGLLDLPAFLGEPREDTRIYACGPAPLLDALATAAACWPSSSVRTERFVARDRSDGGSDTSFELTLARSGRTIVVGRSETVLEAVAAAGVDVLSSCRQGTCGTCETTVLVGRPDHRDSILDDDDRQAGDCMFPCVSRAVPGDRLVLDL